MPDLPLAQIFTESSGYAVWKEGVAGDAVGTTLEARFNALPALPAVIVQVGAEVRLISRHAFFKILSRQFGREIFLNRPLQELIASEMPETLIIDDQTDLATACRLALGRAEAKKFEPILLVSSTDTPSVISTATLLTAQADALDQALREQYQLAAELTEAKRRAEFDATHDALTGLLNRKGFLARMQRIIVAGSSEAAHGLLFLDLDRFKIINDSLGHNVGNELLCQVSQRLLAIAARHGADAADPNRRVIVGRHSGDEFVTLCPLAGPGVLSDIASEINQAITAPYLLEGKPYTIGVSIGMVGSLAPYTSYEAALRDADIAMYQAKNSASRKIVLFEPRMHARVERRLVLERDLQQAVGRDELLLHFQPIVGFGADRPYAYEALVRWRSPHGLLAPNDFIPLAEETGLINDIGLWVLKAACMWLRGLGEDDVRICVNLSPVQLANVTLPVQLASICASHGVSPSRIIIELTEQSAMASPERATQFLHELKKFGFILALDDFGTGYSSLHWLHKLPIDLIKIDKSLVAEVATSSSAAKLAAGILHLCNSVDLRAVAEGVETEQQAQKLHAAGFSLMQGYYFGRPMPDAPAWPRGRRTELVTELSC